MSKLYLGPCEEVMQGFSDGSVDLIVTDPPYGISYKSGHQRVDRRMSIVLGEKKALSSREDYFEKIENDDALPVVWLPEAYRVLKPGGAAYVFVHWRTAGLLIKAMKVAGFTVKNMIVIRKSNHGMGDLKGSFAPKHELLVFATKGRHILTFPEKRESDVWELPVKFTGARKFHSNEKPTSWTNKPIIHSSRIGDTVLDPFMGSGSTGDSCKGLARRFIGIELSKKDYNVADKRLRGGNSASIPERKTRKVRKRARAKVQA